jgi:hypothetical protein
LGFFLFVCLFVSWVFLKKKISELVTTVARGIGGSNLLCPFCFCFLARCSQSFFFSLSPIFFFFRSLSRGRALQRRRAIRRRVPRARRPDRRALVALCRALQPGRCQPDPFPAVQLPFSAAHRRKGKVRDIYLLYILSVSHFGFLTVTHNRAVLSLSDVCSHSDRYALCARSIISAICSLCSLCSLSVISVIWYLCSLLSICDLCSLSDPSALYLLSI